MTLDEWIRFGIDHGWVTEACATHDGVPMSADEERDWAQGYGPCQPVLRVWFDGATPRPTAGR